MHDQRLLKLLAVLALFMISLVNANSWTSTPVTPPSYPLAVRSPYLSAWLSQGSGNALNGAWPQFWTGSTLGWAGYIRVDGTAYVFLGDPVVSGLSPSQATQKAANYTSTQSIFTLDAGPVTLTATFLSPVEPKNITLQSLPFSYLAIDVASNDGSSHSVEVYSDISGEWLTGNNSLTATWSTNFASDVTTHYAQLQDQQLFTEISDRAQYGSVYYSTANVSGMTYMTGADVDVRGQFIRQGVLNNTEDTNYRAVSDNWPVFAFAVDLGDVSNTTSSPLVFTIGHVRDPVIQYIVADAQIQQRSSYFWSTFSSVFDAISFFHSDYSSALSVANAFDVQLLNDANQFSSEYAAYTSLSVRQVLGTTEITISKDSSGNWNTSDILMFMKEISSDGNVNTVDVIFPSWPAFLYMNPTLGQYLLQGLFEYQATGQWPNAWSIHDLGNSYPNATGHNNGQDENMPLEECGNMLIMTYSLYQKTNDKTLISTYYSLLKQWTQFLIAEALIPENQISTDDFAGSLANQTNLAVKGIIGIGAMSKIASIMDDNEDASNYSSIASTYVEQWQKLATSSDGKHLTLNYGDDNSWGLSYNLYGDKLLGLNLFPDSVYEMQDAWYQTVSNKYGVPLDTRHTYTKTDWQTFMAAVSVSDKTRQIFINADFSFMSSGNSKNTMPFSDWYDTTTGVSQGFRARPVVGGHFALLVSSTNTTSSSSSPSSPSSSTSKSSGTLRSTCTQSTLYLVMLSLILQAIRSFLP